MSNITEEEKNIEKLISADISHHFFKSKGLKIHYITAGHGTPLLLLHGANMGWLQWYKNIASLSKKFTVYALDLPGSGRSSKVDYQKNDLIDILVQSVEDFIKYKKLDKLDIVGHSLGSFIVLKLALIMNKRINKIVLISPIGMTRRIPLRQIPLLFYPVAIFITQIALKPSKKNLEKFLKSALINKKSISDDLISYYYLSVTSKPITHPIMLIHNLIKNMIGNKRIILINKLKHISQPALLIIGGNDQMISLKQLAVNNKLMPNSKMLIYKNTGHVPPLENSEKFNEDVIRFLER